ncbi:hypothetical protein SDC9_64314 [bioreactor metagenome]|uniref:Flagellar hook-length control protein-like C-terminal domain-containing protein n=1 Tax=bioreactor metagenome TaxID=1076179 RepID=A0A644XUW4_9ZZZZ
MISMVSFEFGFAEGLMAAKKDVAASGGGFEEFLSRTAAQLSGNPPTNENAAAKDAKNNEGTVSIKPAGGEKKESDDKAPEDDTALSAAPSLALAAALLAAPLPPQVQEALAQDLTAGVEANVQRAAEVERPVPDCQAAMTLQAAPPEVREGDTVKAPDAQKAGETGEDFEAVLSDAKIVQPKAQNKTAEFSPQEDAGAKAPLTFKAKEETIRVTQTNRSEETDFAADMGETAAQTKTADLQVSVKEAEKLEPKTLPSANKMSQTAADTESTAQKTSVRSAEVQPAARSPEKSEKPREKIQFAETVEPTNTKLTAREGVDSPVPEAKTEQIRQPVFEQVAKEVTKTAKDMPADGFTTFDIKLYPEGLGKLEVRMTCEGSNLALTVTAHSEEAAKLLTGGAEKLRNTLSENYQVTHLEIRTEIRTDTQSGTAFFANGFGGSGHYGSGYAKEQTRYVESERDIGTDVVSERRIPVGVLDTRV